MTIFMSQPDNFALYQPLVAGALWMAARGLKGHPRSFALGGLLVGLATLSRNDGVLVGAVLGLTFLYDRWRAWRTDGARPPAIPWSAAIACAALFLARHGPVVDPPARGVRLALAVDRVGQGPVHPRRSRSGTRSRRRRRSTTCSGMGLGPLLVSRIGGLVAAIVIFTTLVAAGILLPFMIIGGWARRRSVDFGPFFAYAAILFAFSAIVSAVHVPGGTFIHSAVALAPHAYILALEGIAVAVGVDRGPTAALEPRRGHAAVHGLHPRDRRPRRDPGRDRTYRTWDGVRVDRKAVAAALDLAGAAPDARIMSIDAAGFRYWTGRGGVVSPNDPIDTIRAGRRGLRDRVARRRAGRHRPRPRAGRGRRPAAVDRPAGRHDPGPGRRSPPRSSTRSASAPRTSAARRSRRPRRRLARSLTHDRRDLALQALLVFAVALLVRILAASIVVFPQPEDTAYYVGVARNLLDGHGLTSDAIWSFQTPPLVVPAAGVRGLAAAADVPRRDPDGDPRLDVRRRPVGVGRRRGGRAGARVADRRRRGDRSRPAAGRVRVLAVGAGLTAAVYLPLVLHSALPDSTMPFAVLALSACAADAAAAARGRDAPARRLAADRRSASLIGLAALTRNEAAFVGFAWLVVVWAATRRAGPPEGRPRRGAGARRARRLRPVDGPRLARVREPAAGPGARERALGDRLRHLRLVRPADAVALPRGRAGGAARDARRRPRPQPVHGPADPGLPDVVHRARRAAVVRPPAVRRAARDPFA